MRDQKGKAKWLGAQLHWPSNSEGRQDQGKLRQVQAQHHIIAREKNKQNIARIANAVQCHN